MNWDIIATYAVAACLIVGAAFSLIGSIGLLKFNDSMTRLHAPTKVGTVGIGALLLAAMIHSYTIGEGVLHEALIMAFLFVTAPISANFMAKVNIHRRDCDMPPPPTKDEIWSTLDVPEADRELSETAGTSEQKV
ncbi:monovalent cation/H(+) antiporter subunit G [Roseovarius nanhaiticus]|uniref:Multisubunit potassium/proton antiporter, PhaG subunit n=1 Tax=Roseovarius nanhaiticus TaxID=573024 RepID=A0A1N7FGA4_9RHOB|nr:monovalent cation/H(+) antiporter subunit G [Roseovarius nanhaiticus]SEK55146.1 multisubunit potassium/proton antiporter, PhaG subunit [Roseovarius nanhaiticus]SIR99371.1 multisubunit potassium/proton antiporter, PhaG subunit [Roseovarius nanhaiticus]